MAFDFTSALSGMRKIVHSTMGHAATYSYGVQAAQAVKVRWHDKQVLQGNLGDAGYSEVVEGIDRLIFNKTELVANSVVLKKGGKVTLGPQWNNAVLNLEVLEPSHGPEDVIWKVSR